MPAWLHLWSDVFDVVVVAALIYAAIALMRDARAHLAMLGIGILACVYLLARQLGLGLTAWLFQAFFAVFLVVLIVIFQAELRQAFERLALWGLRVRPTPALPALNEVLVRSCSELISARQGALIVLPGADNIDRHIQGGIPLAGHTSVPLLLSLFDPSSPGHDGAVVLEGERVRSFAAHLPLSTDFAQLKLRGTRHAAALGLAERTDALCIVVSEERSCVSVAQAGRLRQLANPAEVAAVLADFEAGGAPPASRTFAPFDLVRARWRDMGIAAGASLLLWALVVPGSDEVTGVVRARVVVQNLPPGYELERVEPANVEVGVRGLRRDLFLFGEEEFEVVVDGLLVELGRRTFGLAPEAVRHPPEITPTTVEPGRVRLHVRQLAPAAAAPNGARTDEP